MKKRWLAGFLALILVLGCIPTVAAEASFDSFFAGFATVASAENDASYPYGDYLEEGALVSCNVSTLVFRIWPHAIKIPKATKKNSIRLFTVRSARKLLSVRASPNKAKASEKTRPYSFIHQKTHTSN